MVFKCQEDSFLKEFTTKVVSSELTTFEWTPPGHAVSLKLFGYNVVCEDTILFPEGGGQPCDYGLLGGHPVRNVMRIGKRAVHFVETVNRFEDGCEIKQSLDWNRRFDHMQQHSGQHLITALFDREYKYDTKSWWLGKETSYIELSTTHLISRESLDTLEQKANELIRESRAVTVTLADPTDAVEFKDARAPRGLPKDHVGLARVVRIEGLESNMCCGTHVSNLSQLQCIKLLFAEKCKNSVLVYFIVGGRAIRKLGECFERELEITQLINGGPKQHVELIDKMLKNMKTLKKSNEKLIRDLAFVEASRLDNAPEPLPKYYSLHRKDGIDPDFIESFFRTAPEGVFYFLTVSEILGTCKRGLMVLRGDPDLVQEFGPKFMELLDGRGTCRNNRYQGKFNDGSRLQDCEAMLVEYFRNAAEQES